MANENKQEEQPTTPDPQVELTDEQLEQVVGGGVIIHDSPVVKNPGSTIIGPDI